MHLPLLFSCRQTIGRAAANPHLVFLNIAAGSFYGMGPAVRPGYFDYANTFPCINYQDMVLDARWWIKVLVQYLDYLTPKSILVCGLKSVDMIVGAVGCSLFGIVDADDDIPVILPGSISNRRDILGQISLAPFVIEGKCPLQINLSFFPPALNHTLKIVQRFSIQI